MGIGYSEQDFTQTDILAIIENTSAGNWDAAFDELKNKKGGSGPDGSAQPEVKPEENHETEIDKIANAEIVKLDTNKVKIAELKQKYATLQITDLKDKEGLKAVKEAKAVIRTARTTVEKKRVDLKSDYLEIGRRIDAAAKEYKDLLVEIEGPLDEMLAKYDEWEKEERTRKEREENERLDKRVTILKDAGMSFNGSYYVIGETISMDVVTIKGWSDFDFEAFLAKVKIEKSKLDAAAEQQRIAQEEENKLNNRIAILVKNGIMFNGSEYVIGNDIKVTRENIKAMDDVAFDGFANDVKLEKQRILDEQEKYENDKKQLEKEKEDMRKEKIQMRETSAHNIGLTFNPVTMSYGFNNGFGSYSVSKQQIETMENEAWGAMLKEYHAGIMEANKKQSDEKEKQQKWEQMVNSRIGQLTALGMVKQGRNHVYPGAAAITISIDVIDNEATDWIKQMDDLENAIIAFKDKLQKEKELFEQRSYELTNLGLGILNGVFIRKNEFGDQYFISIEEVKSIDADNWSSRWVEIENAVKELNALTDSKRHAAEEEKRKAIPEAAQITEYLHYVANVSVPQITNGKLKEILDSFGTGLTNLIDVATSEIDNLNIQ